MKKLSSLLKKVDFFEKLAIHGSRRNALKALAEDPMIKVKRLVEDSFFKLQELLGEPEMEVLKSTVIMPSVITDMLDYSELTDFVADISSTADEIKQKMIATGISTQKAVGIILYVQQKIYEAAQELKSINNPDMTSSVSIDNAPSSSKMKGIQYPSIDPSIQEELNKFLVTKMGKPRIITPDGKLGPQTRMSIEMIKKHLGMSGSSDTDVFNRVHTELVGMNPWEEMMTKKKQPSSTPEYDSEPGGIEEILKIENDPYMPDTI